MADSPLEGEATQALFCAVADYVGKAQIDRVLDLEKYPTYQSFLKSSGAKKLIDTAYAETQIPGITLGRMETFLKDNPSYPDGCVIDTWGGGKGKRRLLFNQKGNTKKLKEASYGRPVCFKQDLKPYDQLVG